MQGTADGHVTIVAGQVLAGHGQQHDLMGEGTVSEGYVSAVDVVQPGGPVGLEDVLRKRHAAMLVLGRLG